ncbi:hypothetical protein BDR07DRAFT_1377024 [Suillus spraguei]|nr:hypothetical protein BDR07DRAFT_1377024 [Suillus spraguei]
MASVEFVLLRRLQSSHVLQSAFKQECSMFYIANADAACATKDHNRAIDLYSMAIALISSSDTIIARRSRIDSVSSIDTIFASRSRHKSVIGPNFPSGTIFANRSKAKSENGLWEDVLLDAEKVIELDPSSHVGYQAFQTMLSELDKAPDIQIRRRLREQFISPSLAEAQTSAFKTSSEYKELLLLSIRHPLRTEEVVATYFRRVMLSRRWEGKEPLLRDIQDKIVYKLNSLGGIVKLRKLLAIQGIAGHGTIHAVLTK